MIVKPLFSRTSISFGYLLYELPGMEKKDAILINAPRLNEEFINLLLSFNLKAVLLTSKKRSLTNSIFTLSKIFDIPFLFNTSFPPLKNISIDEKNTAYTIENYFFVSDTGVLKDKTDIFTENTLILSGESPISCSSLEEKLQTL